MIVAGMQTVLDDGAGRCVGVERLVRGIFDYFAPWCDSRSRASDSGGIAAHVGLGHC